MVFYVSNYNEFQREMSNFTKIIGGKTSYSALRLKCIHVSVDGGEMKLTGTNGYTAYERVMEIDNPDGVKTEFTIPIETAKMFKKVRGNMLLKIELKDNVVVFAFGSQTITCINDQSLTKSYPIMVSKVLHDEPKNGYRLKVDAKLLIDILQSFDEPFIVINLDHITEPIHVEEAGQKKAVVLPMRFDSKQNG